MKKLLLLPLLALACNAGTNQTYTVTAYCSCTKCCGKWAGGPTASGRKPQAGVTIAAPRALPFGTWLDIEGVGRRRVDDRLARRYDNRIDVYFPTHAEALRFGKRKLTVRDAPRQEPGSYG
jgi:3D (Asp-Asp-Asp) domain-containing protein